MRRADVRRGDVLLTLVHKGQHIELKSVEQFNKLLAGLDKSAVFTLQVRRGDAVAFVTVSGWPTKARRAGARDLPPPPRCGSAGQNQIR